MKKLLYLAVFSLSLSGISAVIIGFPDGRYLGSGSAKDDAGNFYHYESYIEFSSNNTRADYAWDTDTTTVSLSFYFNDQGNFDVAENGSIIGNGYCMSFQCHYDIILNGQPFSEVFSFIDGHLYKLGKSKDAAGNPLYWEENLWNLEPSRHSTLQHQ